MRPRLISAILFFLTFSVSSLVAETVVDISGQVRVRGDLSKILFYTSSDPTSNPFMRSRLSVNAIVDSNVNAIIEIQDSRVFESEDGNGPTSGSKKSVANVDLYQASFEVKQLLVPRLSFKAGRFEFTHGNERLFGCDDWDRFGLTFNGAILTYGDFESTVSLFGLSGPEEGDIYEYRIFGGMAHLKKCDLSPLFYYEGIKDRYNEQRLNTSRYTIAVHGKRDLAWLSFEYNAAYQTGTEEDIHWVRSTQDSLAWVSVPVAHDQKIESWLITARLSGQLFSNSSVWFAGMDASSGDPNDLDTEEHTFAAPFRSMGNFRGSEQFVGDRSPQSYLTRFGIVELYAGVTVEPVRSTSFTLNVHHFSAQRGLKVSVSEQQPYTRPYHIATGVHDFGWQTDLEIMTTAVGGMDWKSGVSVFIPTDEYARSRRHDPGYYLYTQMTVDF